MKLKTITITFETENGLIFTHTFLMPEYRSPVTVNPHSMIIPKIPKSPILWIKQLLSRFINI